MPAPVSELAIIIALVLTSGLFAMSEVALVSARKSRLRTAVDLGNKKADTALALSQTRTRFLSTFQIGISLIGTLVGAFAGASFAQMISK
jgi:putative hemolysin